MVLGKTLEQRSSLNRKFGSEFSATIRKRSVIAIERNECDALPDHEVERAGGAKHRSLRASQQSSCLVRPITTAISNTDHSAR